MCHVTQYSPVSPHNYPDFPLRLKFVCSITWVSPTVSQKPEPVTSLYFRIPHGHKLGEVGYSKEGAKPKSGSSLCGEEASEVMWRIGRPMKEETYVAKQNLKNRTAAGLDTRNFSQASPLGRGEEEARSG